MKLFSYTFFLLIVQSAFSQKVDTLYIATYPQKFTLAPYVSNNALYLGEDNRQYVPNNPFTAGIMFSIKNTVVNVKLGTAVTDLKSSEYGETKITDFQIHKYARNFILDVFLQNYEGFYTEESTGITLFPDVAVRQLGAEWTYLFNSRTFSARAAFQQSEKQLQSAGSCTLGGGIYAYRLNPGAGFLPEGESHIDNIQFGANAGYVYSWVADKHWLLTGMATAGLNVGNNPESLKDVKLKVYPTASARGSATYNKNGWSAAFTMLINNKVLYLPHDKSFTVTSLGFQFAYIKRFDSFKR